MKGKEMKIRNAMEAKLIDKKEKKEPKKEERKEEKVKKK